VASRPAGGGAEKLITYQSVDEGTYIPCGKNREFFNAIRQV